MAKLTVAHLEALFTADTTDIGRAEKVLNTAKDKVDKNPITQKVTAETKGAVADMKAVEDAARRIVSAKTFAKVDADISSAEKQFTRLYEKVDYLRAIQPEMQVDADITRAVKQMERAQARLDGLRGARAVMEIDADTAPLEAATDGAGEKAGKKVGGGVETSLIAALTAIPVAGGVLLAGKAIGEGLIGAIQEGMQIDVRQDRLQALTGISPEQARKIAFAAGEAYASNFGASIESNMDISRLGLQFGIIDEKTSTRDAQKVIEGLSGIADALEEDVKPTAAAVATLLHTGLAGSAQEAFDILAAGARNGLNRNEDLLDSLTEYPTVMRELGLSGKEYLGLLNQGLDAGARNSDIVADGLKEIQLTLRNREGADALKQLGLNAEDTYAAFAEGGPRAREGLEQILTGMRDIEDPVQRNQVALDLFKTKAEDLGDALYALDLTNAVEQLGLVDGAARKMFDTLSDNDASKMETAKRNVEVAVQGIQGALAAGFSEPLAQAAEFVSQNRGPVMQFFLDLANGALDFGSSMVNSAADGAIAFSEFIAGPGADMIDMLIGIQKSINPFSDTSKLEGLRDGMREADDATRATADTMRNELLGGIEQARAKVNEFGGEAVALGFLNDASLRLAGSIANVGVNADGTKLSLEGVDLANLRASESGRALDGQLRSAVDAMRDELDTAAAAGESQEQLAGRYDTTRQALYDSLIQMGLTDEQAQLLIQTYGAVPSLVPTAIQTNAPEVRAEVERLVAALNNIPGHRDVVINQMVRDTGADRGQVAAAYNAQGAVLLPRARGAIDGLGLGLTPMRPLAQMVPPDTYRVVGDRSDVAELFAPLDGSPRSWSLLMEGFRRMPGAPPMAEGGLVGQAAGSAPAFNVGPIDARVDMSPREHELRRLIIETIRDYNRDLFGGGGRS